MALREYRTNRTCRECGITRRDIDSISVYDLKTLIKTFVNGLVKLGEGGPKLSSNGYGVSLLSGFIIQLRDWEEWLVNNRLRTVGGVGLTIEIEIGPSVLSL